MIKKKDFLKEYNIEKETLKKDRDEMGRTEFHLRQLLSDRTAVKKDWQGFCQ